MRVTPAQGAWLCGGMHRLKQGHSPGQPKQSPATVPIPARPGQKLLPAGPGSAHRSAVGGGCGIAPSAGPAGEPDPTVDPPPGSAWLRAPPPNCPWQTSFSSPSHQAVGSRRGDYSRFVRTRGPLSRGLFFKFLKLVASCLWPWPTHLQPFMAGHAPGANAAN